MAARNTLEYKKMSSSLSTATSDNLKIRNVHIKFFFVVAVRCFTKAFSVIRFVFINFTLVFPYSQFVVVHLSHSLPLPLPLTPSRGLFTLGFSFATSFGSLRSLFWPHSMLLLLCVILSQLFFPICFNVLFAVHVIAYRPKTKATNINKMLIAQCMAV